ncbi:hypothetical protein B7L51_018060 [Pectobacterium brasiliense]|uniref:hypothetical protein n=1 Tax=Pectobacterium brasiliense TaxID=180957 RepID=UPI00191BA323|nr:hypothetical protein [Pectobacterium carotovorum]
MEKWLDGKISELFVGPIIDGRTLEPQLIAANGEAHLRNVMGITDVAKLEIWMSREKTEGALRIAKSKKEIVPPAYMKAAAEFIHNV